MIYLICSPDQQGIIDLVNSSDMVDGEIVITPYMNEKAISNLTDNDTVISTGLPPKIMAEIIELGAEYINIDFDYSVFKQSKHRNADCATLIDLGARLTIYNVYAY